jgi:arylsulfate sulfotransferase
VTTPVADYNGIGVTGFHHNIGPSREGMILDVDTVDQTESVNLEVDAAGNVLRTWNLADIVSAAMIAGGDDPILFVYPAPTDWFHNNACAYRSSDNSLIVSSRANFVIAIDYDSGNIKWILGDPTGQGLDILANCSRDALRNPFSQLRRMEQKGVAL